MTEIFSKAVAEGAKGILQPLLGPAAEVLGKRFAASVRLWLDGASIEEQKRLRYLLTRMLQSSTLEDMRFRSLRLAETICEPDQLATIQRDFERIKKPLHESGGGVERSKYITGSLFPDSDSLTVSGDVDAISDSEIAVEVSNLSKSYVTGFSLPAITHKFEFGKVYAIVGPNGTGKTTFLRMLAGELAQDAGDLAYPYLGAPFMWEDVKYNTVFVDDRRERVPNLRRHLEMIAAIRGKRNRQIACHARNQLQIFGIEAFAERSLAALSSGELTRARLAIATCGSPKIVVLDEPFAHMDPVAIADLQTYISNIVDSDLEKRCVIFSSHHIEESELIADDGIFVGRNGAYSWAKESGGVAHEIFLLQTHYRVLPRVMAALQDNGFKTRQKGMTLVTESAPNTQGSKILALLEREGLEVHSFRRVTDSIKRRFYDAESL